ncbi:MAG: hypothetical protein AAF990_22100 [Bacteroidota bacterium]
MSYYLPLIINNRRVQIAHLKLGSLPSDFTPEYIIKNTGSSDAIFTIRKNTMLVSGRNKADLALKGMWDWKVLPEEKLLKCELSVGGSGGRPIDDKLSKRLSGLHNGDIYPFFIEPEGEDLQLKYIGDASGEKWRILFEVEIMDWRKEDELKLEFAFEVYIESAENIYEAVFDFGSDSSQMAFRSLKAGQTRIQKINLFDVIHEQFLPQADQGAEHLHYYYQEDPEYFENFHQFDENEYLFQSHFYIRVDREKPSRFVNWESPFYFRNNLDLLEVLMHENRYRAPANEKKFRPIPNLKLIEHGSPPNIRYYITQNGSGTFDRFDFNQRKEEVFQAIFNQFFHALLKGIKESHRRMDPMAQNGRTGLGKNKLRLILLVPNIYKQEKVNNLIKTTIRDARKIFADTEKDYGFDGIEVQTISESDASFLGILYKSTELEALAPSQNYLVVDAGKGTIDISIVKTGEQPQQYYGLYRGGNAGSGHIITFAFIDTLAALVFGSEVEQRELFIRSILMNPDPGLQFDFMRMVEKLKHLYSQRNIENLSEESSAVLDLDQILALPELEQIRNATNESSRNEEINAFLQALDRSGKVLGDYFGYISKAVDHLIQHISTTINESSFKTFKAVLLTGRAFLFPPFRRRLIEHLQSELGAMDVKWFPDISKESCLYGPLNISRGINENSDLVGFPNAFQLNKDETADPKGNTSEDNWFVHLFSANEGVESIREQQLLFYQTGFDINRKNTPYIKIGGTSYEREEGIISATEDQKSNIFYTGNGFIERTENSSSFLRPMEIPPKNINYDAVVWMSLFPYVRKGNKLRFKVFTTDDLV